MQEIEIKYSDEFDGVNRKLFKFTCKCGIIIWIPHWHWENKKYCTKNCIAKTKIKINCDFCNVELWKNKSKLNTKSGLNFCSRTCKDKAQSLNYNFESIWPSHYGNSKGKYNYREKALIEYGTKCKRCGYSKNIKMLDVDHIDSNRENNKVENLQVLCVWCHALKTRQIENDFCKFLTMV